MYIMHGVSKVQDYIKVQVPKFLDISNKVHKSPRSQEINYTAKFCPTLNIWCFIRVKRMYDVDVVSITT